MALKLSTFVKPAASSNHASTAAKLMLPWSPFTALIVVVATYFVSQIGGQLLLTVYGSARGWSVAHINDWLSTATTAQFAYILLAETLTLGMLYAFMSHYPRSNAVSQPSRSKLKPGPASHTRISFRDIGLAKPRFRDIGIALVAYGPYFILNAAVTLTAVTLFHIDTEQEQQIGFEAAKSTLELCLTFVSLAVLPPLVEEIVMRGFLFTSLRKRFPVVIATLLTSVVFATAHLQFGSGAPLLWLAAIDTFVLSLVLCYLRQKTGSLWAGIGLHALKNSLAFIVIFIVPKFS